MRDTNDTSDTTNIRHIAIFGANGRVGGPMARFLAEQSPKTRLRLLVRSEESAPALQHEFPNAEVRIANYYDLPSLERAFEGIDGLFVVTPPFLDEERAMTNLIHAARGIPGLVRIVRLLADPPGMTVDRVPLHLKHFTNGLAVQHIRAKALLEASGLPVTYINIAAGFMQNLLTTWGRAIPATRTLIIPCNRRYGFIDTADIGACAASILLSGNHRHRGQTYHIDNGHDVMYMDEVADLMSEVFGERITYDGTIEAFERMMSSGRPDPVIRPARVQYMLDYFEWEKEHEVIWRKSDIVEYLTGRPAKKLRDWLAENKDAILGSVAGPS